MIRVSNIEEYNEAKSDAQFSVVHFYADWCKPSCQLNEVFENWIKEGKYAKVKFVAVDAERANDVNEAMNVSSVPIIVFLRNGNFVCHIEGAQIQKIEDTIDRLFYAVDSESPLNTRLENIIKRAPIVVFLTGTPSDPQCGFTSQICTILSNADVKFDYFDIMTDEEVLRGLKKFSNWPTYPQVYVNGELVGGCDMIKEAAAKGKLRELLKLE
mmetsp:Transcript_33678/g.52652  ORF Transcript_33678/g.52652 Transcript_33678/m.52652 type:complete len:213 (-) Transcript_33678:40-678(-)